MTEMVETWINDRWPLLLPKHRHDRPEWSWWEAGRLASMWHHLVGNPGGGLLADEWLGLKDLPNGEVVYDIGSEEGDFPALFSSWGCDVVLFEPNDRVWPNIKAIWEANDLRPPEAIWDGFAGSSDYCAVAETRLHMWPEAADGPVIHDHGFRNLSENDGEDRAMVITIDTMASLVKPPTAITIDVEGAEYEVLLGARETLRTHKPKVWVSIHRQFAAEMYGMNDVLASVQDIFAESDYPDDGRGVFIASDHEEHWQWLP